MKSVSAGREATILSGNPEFPGIDQRLIQITAIISVPLELFALFGLYAFLFDLTYPTGTSEWWVALGMAGFCIHFFGILLISNLPTPDWAVPLIIPFVGYAVLFFLVMVAALGFRTMRCLLSRRCARPTVPGKFSVLRSPPPRAISTE